MIEKKLTVAITTYNRQEALITQLKSLESQGNFDEYLITIFNNKSDYDVEKALRSALTPAFFKIITIYNRKFNVGGDCNIALSLLQVETPWMWLLSDDDVTMPGALEAVLNDIEIYDDVCWLKYSIDGFAKFQDRKINNLVDLFDSFRKDGHNWGEYVFMSNNVYNLAKLEKVRGNILYWAMTSYPQIMGPLMAIKNDGKIMAFRSTALTNYEAGRISYKLHYAFLNFPHIVNSSFELSKRELAALKNMFNLGAFSLLFSLFEVDNKAMRYEFYKQYKIFYLSNSCVKKMCFIVAFKICNSLNFNLERLLGLKSQIRSLCFWKK